MFNAFPSIRGGDPGDMTASLDGFYVFWPYFWGGGFSIFDPRMVESAQLSHGVFSTRYGHTISGLLDITTKKPSTTETELEISVNTSAANFNLSLPLAGKGGILIMGRATYYAPIVFMAKQIAKIPGFNEDLANGVNSIKTAPFIRAGTITGNYRFTDNVELNATGFFGMDGIAVRFENSSSMDDPNSVSGIFTNESLTLFDNKNYQGFFNTNIIWNPRNDMLLKFTAGAGLHSVRVDGDLFFNVENKNFSQRFKDTFAYLAQPPFNVNMNDSYSITDDTKINNVEIMYNIQGRIDYDWELRDGILIAAGVQEVILGYHTKTDIRMNMENQLRNFSNDDKNAIFNSMDIPPDSPLRAQLEEYLMVSTPALLSMDVSHNMVFGTSAYGLVELNSPNGRLGSELGLRVDHFHLIGDDFTIHSKPTLNPRLNLDFNLLRNQWIIESLSFNAGTGLFSSMNNMTVAAESHYGINEIVTNRSWTSVSGLKFNFPQGINLNIEGYYKYVFNRMYMSMEVGSDGNAIITPNFDGEGQVWGLDLMLQKVQSRFWDGWITYSYNWAKYRDPNNNSTGSDLLGFGHGSDWYFPSFHRFHTLNIVFNIRPVQRINIYTRFSLASGGLLQKREGDGPQSYPVYVYDPASGTGHFIEKYFWHEVYDQNNRATTSMQMDLKFSLFGGNTAGKTRYEFYFAIENALALLYTSRGNTSFNPFTGELETGNTAVSYDMPIPIPSFGFKLSY
jgi:hypothetical protein